MTRVVLLSNPSSGSADSECLEELTEVLSALGDVGAAEPSSEHFDEEVNGAARHASHVVVAGGDGTMNRVVNALEARLDNVVFGLVPMGTGNDLARTLELPLEPVDAAERVALGGVRAIDYGRATGGGVSRLFTNACIGGFPVAVNEAIDEDSKRQLGPAAFWLGGAKAAAELERSTVRINGIEVADCVAAGVGNGKTAGGGIELWPSAAPDDGALNGCALPARNHAAALKLAALVKGGGHERLEGVVTEVGPTIHIDSDPPIEINVDGELVGLTTPATFEVAGRLRVCC